MTTRVMNAIRRHGSIKSELKRSSVDDRPGMSIEDDHPSHSINPTMTIPSTMPVRILIPIFTSKYIPISSHLPVLS